MYMYVYIHVYSYARGHGVLKRERCDIFVSYSKLHILFLNMWLGNTTVLQCSLSATTSSCALWNVLVCRCVHSTGHWHRAIRRADWLPRSHRSTASSHVLPPPTYRYANKYISTVCIHRACPSNTGCGYTTCTANHITTYII